MSTMEASKGTSGDSSGAPRKVRAGSPLWTPEKAREAAQKRWENQRRREAEEQETLAALPASASQDVRLVPVPIQVGAIIQRLHRDALAGSATSAKELRAWLETYPPSDDAFSVEALEHRQVLAFLARMEAEMEAETGPKPVPPPTPPPPPPAALAEAASPSQREADSSP